VSRSETDGATPHGSSLHPPRSSRIAERRPRAQRGGDGRDRIDQLVLELGGVPGSAAARQNGRSERAAGGPDDCAGEMPRRHTGTRAGERERPSRSQPSLPAILPVTPTVPSRTNRAGSIAGAPPGARRHRRGGGGSARHKRRDRRDDHDRSITRRPLRPRRCDPKVFPRCATVPRARYRPVTRTTVRAFAGAEPEDSVTTGSPALGPFHGRDRVDTRRPSRKRARWTMTSTAAPPDCGCVPRAGRRRHQSPSSRAARAGDVANWHERRQRRFVARVHRLHMSRASPPRTSPTMMRSGRIRSALRTRSRTVISLGPPRWRGGLRARSRGPCRAGARPRPRS